MRGAMEKKFIKCHPLQRGLVGVSVCRERIESIGRASRERREVHFRKHLYLPSCWVRGLKSVIVRRCT